MDDEMATDICQPPSNNCSTGGTPPPAPWTEGPEPWEEVAVWGGFRRWHVMLLSALVLQAVVVLFCCACRCRVPRTKQEIEADYIRRKISRKFRKQLDIIKNSEMDTMDLMKALERLRQELKEDTASLAQSEAFSALSFTPTGTPTYRKGSDVNIDLFLEEQNEGEVVGPAALMKERVSTIISSALQKLKR